MTEMPNSGPPREVPRKASPVRVLLMLIVGGLVLGGGGCALFLGKFAGDRIVPLASVGAIIFVIGVLLFVAGVLWALVLGVDRLWRR
jgi:hypothetical protein